MRFRWLRWLCLGILVVVSDWFCPVSNHCLVICSSGGGFQFLVDRLPDGRFCYTARLINLPFPISDQEEEGVLSGAEWAYLANFHPLTRLPEYEESILFDPLEKWGVLQQGTTRFDLRFAEWNELEGCIVGSAFHNLQFEAKRSL